MIIRTSLEYKKDDPIMSKYGCFNYNVIEKLKKYKKNFSLPYKLLLKMKLEIKLFWIN